MCQLIKQKLYLLVIAIENSFISKEYYFILFLFVFFLFSLLKANYQTLFKTFFISFFQKKMTIVYLKNDNVFSQRFDFILNTILIINSSILLMCFSANYDHLNFLKIMMFTISFFILKTIIIRALCYVFNIKELTRFSIFHTFFYEKFLSIIVTPFLFFYFFSAFANSEFLINFFIVLLVLTFFIKVKSLFNVLRDVIGISTLHIILYLCIIEIIPFSLIAKGIFY